MPSINEVKRRRINAERVTTVFKLDPAGAFEKQTVPFVFAVMSNLSGSSKQPSVAQRKLVSVDKASFNSLFEKFKPELELNVKNQLNPGGEDLHVKLQIESMRELTVEGVVEKVPALRELLDKRNQLNRLKGTVGADVDKRQAILRAVKEQ